MLVLFVEDVAKYGFSMSLGTNMCLSCKNSSTSGLITFFVIAGVFLVVFIKLFNLTVSQGTINGLIFMQMLHGHTKMFFSQRKQTAIGFSI